MFPSAHNGGGAGGLGRDGRVGGYETVTGGGGGGGGGGGSSAVEGGGGGGGWGGNVGTFVGRSIG